MNVHSFPFNASLGDVQRYANMKGWRAVKATWTKGIRPKKIRKYEDEPESLDKQLFEIKPHWNLFYIPLTA